MQHLVGGVQSTRPTMVTQGSHNSHENLFNQGELTSQSVNSTLLVMLEQLPKALLSWGKTELLCNRLGESKKGQHAAQG